MWIRFCPPLNQDAIGQVNSANQDLRGVMFEKDSPLIRCDKTSRKEQGLNLLVEPTPIKFLQKHEPGLGSQVAMEPLPGRSGTLEAFANFKKREIQPNP